MAADDLPLTSPIVASGGPSSALHNGAPSPTGSRSVTKSHPQRQSMLAGLTPAQVKRISLALGEIEGRLSRPLIPAHHVLDSDEEETLQSGQHITPTRSHTRLPSDARSEVASEVSSAFPYKESPIGSHLSEGPSPSRLPPSPRTHDLAAQVSQPQPIPFVLPGTSPRPIMTPSRTQPMRHQPSSSISSAIGSPVNVYIPGQPRPVGSAHRSEGSISSPLDGSLSPRAATPSQTSPAPTNGRSTALTGEVASPPTLPTRSTSLGRSQSVTQTAGRAKPSASPAHLRAQSVDTAIALGPAPSQRPSSPIEEEPEEEGSVDSHLPRVQVVPGRFNMADSRPLPDSSTRPGLGRQAKDLSSRVVSQQGTIGSVAPAHEVVSLAQKSPLPLRRARSTQSDGSNFTAATGEVAWSRLFDSDDGLVAAEDEDLARDVLRKLSGVDADELSIMQEKLVTKAKLERLALRGNTDFTPEIAVSASACNLLSCSHPRNFGLAPNHLVWPGHLTLYRHRRPHIS